MTIRSIWKKETDEHEEARKDPTQEHYKITSGGWRVAVFFLHNSSETST